jgi:hypothetical protein
MRAFVLFDIAHGRCPFLGVVKACVSHRDHENNGLIGMCNPEIRFEASTTSSSEAQRQLILSEHVLSGVLTNMRSFH